MDIIKRNFFGLLSSGAFDTEAEPEPMSAFKWRRLGQMVEAQKVSSYFADGLRRNASSKMLNPPSDLLNELDKSKDEIDMPLAILSNGFLNNRLKRITTGERHAIDTSVESLELLNIIVANVNTTLNYGLQLGGIIRLGRYLREKGDKVDFVKIDKWISRLHLLRMAQLQGSILCVAFGFDPSEIPFMKRRENAAWSLLNRALGHTEHDTAQEWNFRQASTGFVINNSSVLRRNLRRSMRYYSYAPLETVSNFTRNFIRSLSEIEE